MEKQEETVTLITDGAYSGKDNHDLAESKNVKLVTTDLTGRDVPEIYAEFEFDEEGTRILKCPEGNAPKSSIYMKPTRQCRASFPRELCANCPNQKNCKAKLYKKVSVVVVSTKSAFRAKQQKEMKTNEFRNLARLRNGVETVPSILRNQYHVDKIPVRGKIPGKFFFGCKVVALNIKKFFNYRKGLGHYAQNPILA